MQFSGGSFMRMLRDRRAVIGQGSRHDMHQSGTSVMSSSNRNPRQFLGT